MFTYFDGMADHKCSVDSTDRQTEQGIYRSAVAGIIGELVIPLTQEYSDATCHPAQYAKGCALATVGIGVNNMIEVTKSIQDVVDVGVDRVPPAVFHHNKLLQEGPHQYHKVTVQVAKTLQTSHNALGCIAADTVQNMAECPVDTDNTAVTKDVIGLAVCGEQPTRVAGDCTAASLGDDGMVSDPTQTGVKGNTLAMVNAVLKVTSEMPLVVSCGDSDIVNKVYDATKYPYCDPPTELSFTLVKHVPYKTGTTDIGTCSLPARPVE